MGIIGMGGFAAAHHRAALQLEKEGTSRLICACDPHLSSFSEVMRRWEFAERGVRVFSDYIAMLDACGEQLDMVVIPTPIQFHAVMHQECVKRGIPVYLEKPPTLVERELERMIKTDLKQAKRTQVGFNFVVEPARLALKRRILAGDFGRLLRVGYRGFAARSSAYFRRNNWAGRIRVGEQPVLDSCMGNAMAHHVHNTLLWAGDGDVFSWSPIASVRAEVYRANPIETADVFFVSADTPSGVKLDLAITHACQEGEKHHEEIIWCEEAVIRYFIYDCYQIEWKDGRRERIPLPKDYVLPLNYRFFQDYLRGKIDRPATLLEDCRPFVQLYNLAFVSSGGIGEIDPAFCTFFGGEVEKYTAVKDIRGVAQRFLDTGLLPSTQRAPWAMAPVTTAYPGDVLSMELLTGGPA